jgi:hypothetical protein
VARSSEWRVSTSHSNFVLPSNDSIETWKLSDVKLPSSWYVGGGAGTMIWILNYSGPAKHDFAVVKPSR